MTSHYWAEVWEVVEVDHDFRFWLSSRSSGPRGWPLVLQEDLVKWPPLSKFEALSLVEDPHVISYLVPDSFDAVCTAPGFLESHFGEAQKAA